MVTVRFSPAQSQSPAGAATGAPAQEPKLLPVTILENIVFGCAPGREPKIEEVYEACRAANIYEALMDKDKFPEGLA